MNYKILVLLMNKDNKVLIYSTRAISSIYSKLLVEQMNIVENFADDIHLMTHTKTDKSYKLAKEISNLNNLKYFKSDYLRFYMEDVIKEKKFNSWDEIIDAIDISGLKDFNRFYLFGGMLSSVNKRFLKSSGNFPYSFTWKFQSLATKYIFICAILKASKEYNIPITEIIFDPQEMSLDLVSSEKLKIDKNLHDLKFNIAIPEYNVDKFDMMQYLYSLKPECDIKFTEKEYDMIFGYTCLWKERSETMNQILKSLNQFEKKQLFTKDIYLDIDTFIPRDEYLKYISKSKYTLIIPSYDRTQVSILRILESIHNNCIPLFTPDNNFDILLKSFPDFNYKDYILDENFKQFSEDEWNNKLKHCKNIFMQIKDFSIKGI